MLESFTTSEFEYKKLPIEEQNKRGILGRLVGVIADFKRPTRNSRSYSESLWERVFNDPITKEKLENRLIYGECGHPADRQEIDFEKIAICLAEKPKKGKDGKLYGVFDILNTPCGKILKTLCDYGSKIGVSSRGSGDTYTDMNGEEVVDPDTYDFVGFDAVILPAVKDARPGYVNESLGSKTLKQALNESLEAAPDEEKKVMKEVINTINEDLDLGKDKDLEVHDMVVSKIIGAMKDALESASKEGRELTLHDFEIAADRAAELVEYTIDEFHDENSEELSSNMIECNDANRTDIEVHKQDEVVNNESKGLIDELQESLKQKADLEKTIISLQEKLSVSYAKEATNNEELSKLKKAIAGLTENANKVNALNKRVLKLTEDLNNSSKANSSLQDKIKELDSKISDDSLNSKSLTGEIASKDANISTLNEEINRLVTDKESLQNQIADLKKDLELKSSDYSKKLGNANKLVESYKKASSTAVDKYIDSQAVMLGVSSNEIKNKLPESYTFDDIDAICEDLQSLKVTRSKLPFQSATIPTNAKVKIKQSQNESLLGNSCDNDIDESLLKLAGLI